VLPVKRVDHISMAATDWRPQAERLERLLGFRFLHPLQAGPTADFEGNVAAVRGTGIDFEIISPAATGSFLDRFLAQQGPGLHHITVEVTSIHAAVAELERLGITPFGGIVDDGEWYVTYIHPKDSGGILWQLFEPHAAAPIERATADGAVNLRRVDHVSLAVADLERQLAWQQRVFGGEIVDRTPTGKRGGYQGVLMTLPNSLLRFEILAPSGPDSFLQRFLDTRRAGMHHLCCEVASIDAACAGLRENGIVPFGGVVEDDWRRYTFIHPRDSGGVLFQLFEPNVSKPS
jgi:methylmalonyl-CoA/ethylmalonyl-CoA epimerase